MYIMHDAVETHSCVDIVGKFTDEQYTTINQSTVGRFNPGVETSYSWLINSCVMRISDFANMYMHEEEVVDQ